MKSRFFSVLWTALVLLATWFVATEKAALAANLAKDTTGDGQDIPHVSVSYKGADGKTRGCLEQRAQEFLIRSEWFVTGDRAKDPEAVKRGLAFFNESLRYRTQKYGYFPTFGDRKLNKHPPAFYAKTVSFMGVSLQVNEQIVAALACVEAALKANQLDHVYHPRVIGGLRLRNTYRGREVSNHVYGIAIDIEPGANTCCGCVAPWPNHPLCKKKLASIYERMAMPRSWVITFERYGFYWLGHDSLQDTMHFEFLGEPEKVLGPPDHST